MGGGIGCRVGNGTIYEIKPPRHAPPAVVKWVLGDCPQACNHPDLGDNECL